MKERPILFSGPMVNAIRDGRKTQTRRKVKPQPPFGCSYAANGAMTHALCFADGPGGTIASWVPPTPKSADHRLPCPYGQPGDRLWVKETFKLNANLAGIRVTYREGLHECQVEFGSLPDSCQIPDDNHWRPSLFMPRWASRILLEIAAVRVEWLQDIRDTDAINEGVPDYPDFVGDSPVEDYRALWESINGPGSWEANPWVWVIEFKVLEGGKR